MDHTIGIDDMGDAEVCLAVLVVPFLVFHQCLYRSHHHDKRQRDCRPIGAGRAVRVVKQAGREFVMTITLSSRRPPPSYNIKGKSRGHISFASSFPA